MLLPRGESLIAQVGLGVAVVLLATMAAAVCLTVMARNEQARAAQRQQISALATALAPSLESLLAQGEWSIVRRMIVDLSRAHELSVCRIVLPDGQILADADPRRITLGGVPQSWPGGPLDEAAPPCHSLISVRQPLLVPGRGGAALEMAARPPQMQLAQSDLLAGLAAIAACGLAAMLLIYRRTRTQLIPLGLIRDALLAARNGETNREALMVAGDSAPEAAGWNELMAELAALQSRASAERVREQMGLRFDGRSELSSACDALSQGLVLLDERGRVRYANGATAVFLRREREELLGADFFDMVQNPDVVAAVRSALGAGARQRKIIEVEREDQAGKSVFRFGVRPPRREDGGSLLITIEDITQQCIAESSRNTFVAQATHELRTPLANIRLYVETALEDGEQDPATRARCLNVINNESRRLERMVGEMLSVAEIEAGSLKLRCDDVRMDRLLDDLKNEFAAQAAGKNIQLEFELPPKLPVIQADRDKLTVALHNLLGNAMKYTPEGGRVTVRILEHERRLLVEVIDTGIGIDEQEQAQVFERFYRARDPRISGITGTGLGLALAREVVRLHGGEITLRSELNKGSTFTLVVPVRQEAA
jgi:signal transduction histidine kinase